MKNLPQKLWLILGHQPSTTIREYPYPTDPRLYPIPGLKPMSDEFYASQSNRVKAFQCADDAIHFCYDCGLELTYIYGYRLVDGKYQEDDVVTEEVAGTDW